MMEKVQVKETHSGELSSTSTTSLDERIAGTVDSERRDGVDGGLLAWLQVLGSFCLFFASWGIVNSFGVYQTYYATILLKKTATSSQISWIGSTHAFLLVSVGVFTGPIFDHGHLQALLYLGSFLTVFGLMMTSISTQYWQIFLAQGVCIGLGSGCLFIPSVAIVATYFTSKRALATGVAVGGGSVGGVIFPITFRQLEPTIGFAWTTRILAFVTLAVLLVAIAVMRARLPPRSGRVLFQPSAFKSTAFTLQSLGVMFGFVGLYVPVFYIQTYALTRQITASGDYAFHLLAILNAGSFFGRILPNFLADKIGPLNMLAPCTITTGMLCFCWISITNVVGITFFAAFYGFFAGAYVSLIPPVGAELTPDMSLVGTWLGMSLFVASFGLLVGNPSVGALIDSPRSQLTAAQSLAGGALLLGAALMCTALVIKSRQAMVARI